MRLMGLVFLLSCFSAQAEKIQILHTNDLHSHLEHAPHRPEVGGYARMKVLIDRHRELARQQGIGTIAMDGGDSMEGNLYYMADKGRKTLEAFNRIGHDVSVLGNHDYLMGAEDLEAIMKDVPPRFGLLAANFWPGKEFPHTRKHLRPVWETEINGVKIGVVGITLNDMLYKWRLRGDSMITGEIRAAQYWGHWLKKRGNHIVIALTHLGVGKDMKIARQTSNIDLIVGGHSHTALKKVVWQKNRRGRSVPIVQAGKYGEWLGRLILDYDKEKRKLSIDNYELIPAISEEKDPAIESLIDDANEDLFALYGKEWLNEVVGKSTLKPYREKDQQDIWHHFLNDSMRESVKSDFSLHAAALSGENYPLGDVTRWEIYNANPRTFDYDDKYGYHIYTAKVSGLLIPFLVKYIYKLGMPLYFSGLTFDWKYTSGGGVRIWNLRRGGKKISPFKRYEIAFSEGIVRGAYGISPLTRLLLQNGRRSEVSMWQAAEEQFRRVRTLTPSYLENSGRPSIVPVERVKIDRQPDEIDVAD